jgi:hypothetical protein
MKTLVRLSVLFTLVFSHSPHILGEVPLVADLPHTGTATGVRQLWDRLAIGREIKAPATATFLIKETRMVVIGKSFIKGVLFSEQR